VAAKLFLDFAHQMDWVSWEVPQAASLTLIVVIFATSFLIARRRHPAGPLGRD
jgi:hypothetical protein